MEKLHLALKNIFPFADQLGYTYSVTIDHGCTMEVKLKGTQSRLFQWCKALELDSPIDFVRVNQANPGRILRELGLTYPTIENWGFSRMDFSMDVAGSVEMVVEMKFFETKIFTENLTRIGHIVANIYMDQQIGELILKEETNG